MIFIRLDDGPSQEQPCVRVRSWLLQCPAASRRQELRVSFVDHAAAEDMPTARQAPAQPADKPIVEAVVTPAAETPSRDAAGENTPIPPSPSAHGMLGPVFFRHIVN